jgi:hypothetical protein
MVSALRPAVGVILNGVGSTRTNPIALGSGVMLKVFLEAMPPAFVK